MSELDELVPYAPPAGKHGNPPRIVGVAIMWECQPPELVPCLVCGGAKREATEATMSAGVVKTPAPF